MKVYFIFDLKDEFKLLYSNNQRILFSMLKQLYFLDKTEFTYGYNLFSQLAKPIPKHELDKKIFIEFHKDIPYSKKDQIHYINNLYKDEISRLEIKRSYIKLETEQSFSSFFPMLADFSDNYFVCEFNKQDFFFLNKEEYKSNHSKQLYSGIL